MLSAADRVRMIAPRSVKGLMIVYRYLRPDRVTDECDHGPRRSAPTPTHEKSIDIILIVQRHTVIGRANNR